MDIFETLVSISGCTWLGIGFSLLGLGWALVYGIKVFGLTIFGNISGDNIAPRRKLYRRAGTAVVIGLIALAVETAYFFLLNPQYEHRTLQQLSAAGWNLYAFPLRLIVVGGIMFFFLHPVLSLAKEKLNDKQEKFWHISSLEPDISKHD